MPYHLQNDDWIVSAFLLSFMLIVWAVSRSWTFLEGWWTGFFRIESNHRKKFTKQHDVQLNGCIPIVISASLLLGILVMGYVQLCIPEAFHEHTPSIIFGISVGGVCGIIVLKLVLYTIINSIFFNKEQRGEWIVSYLVTLLYETLFLLPLAAATIFWDIPLIAQKWWLISILIVIEALRFIKLKVTFFHGLLAYFHIFLYFCTLNLATTLIGWRLLTQIKLLLDTVK